MIWKDYLLMVDNWLSTLSPHTTLICNNTTSSSTSQGLLDNKCLDRSIEVEIMTDRPIDKPIDGWSIGKNTTNILIPKVMDRHLPNINICISMIKFVGFRKSYHDVSKIYELMYLVHFRTHIF